MSTHSSELERPARQVRALFDYETVTVYQAYPPPIANAAVSAGTFVPPFRHNRMTWIKPSFLWMMYRSDWGRKEDQERILAIRITRSGFQWALSNSCLTTFDRHIHGDWEQWASSKENCPVRVQWDPDRSITLTSLPYRAIQVGLSKEAVTRYLTEWIVSIKDITPTVSKIRDVASKDCAAARQMLPTECPLALPAEVLRRIGA